MNIKQVEKINDYSACTGDLLLTKDSNGTEQYLLFCESDASIVFDEERFSKFYFVNIKSGYMFEQELHSDDEIKVGTKINGCGAIIKIVPSDDIEVLLHESKYN